MEGGLLSPPSNYKKISFTEIFEKHCSYYMAMGMSYSDFWDGEVDMTHYTRQVYEHKKRVANEGYWLQGLYVYDLLLKIWPSMRLGAKTKVKPYREEPIPVSEKQESEISKKKEKARFERNRAYMINFATQFNEKHKEKR